MNYLQPRVDNNNHHHGNEGVAGSPNNNIGWTSGNNYNSMPANPQFPQFPFFPFPQFPFPNFQYPNYNPFPNVYNNQPHNHPQHMPFPNHDDHHHHHHHHNQMPYPQHPNHPMPDGIYQQRPTDRDQQPIPDQIHPNRPTNVGRPDVAVIDRGQQPDQTQQIRPPNIGFVDRGQQPLRPQIPTKTQTSTLDHQQGVENNNGNFATDSFFAGSEDREWTQEQESKWQATTKAPFFENTVPGNEKLTHN